MPTNLGCKDNKLLQSNLFSFRDEKNCDLAVCPNLIGNAFNMRVLGQSATIET